MAGQTYRDLEDALDEGPWQVFHFGGHGGYDRRADEGTLAFAGETGRTQPVGADEHVAKRLSATTGPRGSGC